MRSGHDKLDQQIENLLREKYSDEEDDTREVIIDRKYAYDDIIGDTKKIEGLDEIDYEYDEEVEEPQKEVKKMTRVQRLEQQDNYPKHSREEKNSSQDEDDGINYPLLITGAIFFVVFFISMIVFFVYF